MKIIQIERSINHELGFSLEILEKESKEFPKNSDQNIEARLVDCDEDACISILKKFENPDLRKEFSLSVFKEDFYLSQSQDLGDDYLFPVIALDSNQKELMVAWAKSSSLHIALEKNLGTYFSRSRNKEWTKGEDSGHFQKLRKIEYVAKPFYIVYHVDQVGAACHTGYYTCFFREVSDFGKLTQISVPKMENFKHE